jgi:hypothetical protein
LRHAILKDGTWIAQNIDTQDAPGKFNSMTLDKSGHPQVAYIGLYGTKLKYARFDGTAWIRSVLEAPNSGIEQSHGDTGMGNSIAIDPQGNPMISYFNTESLKFAHLVNGRWKFAVVDSFPLLDQWGWRYFRSTIVLDQSGYPHIGYQSPLGLKHAWWDGTRWNTQLLMAHAGTTFDGAMGIDSKDNLYFSYTDPVDRTLKLAIGHRTQAKQAAEAGAKQNPKN